jgi:hypothetical protein
VHNSDTCWQHTQLPLWLRCVDFGTNLQVDRHRTQQLQGRAGSTCCRLSVSLMTRHERCTCIRCLGTRVVGTHISVTRPAVSHVTRSQPQADVPALAFQPLMLLADLNSCQLSHSPTACSRMSPERAVTIMVTLNRHWLTLRVARGLGAGAYSKWSACMQPPARQMRCTSEAGHADGGVSADSRSAVASAVLRAALEDVAGGVVVFCADTAVTTPASRHACSSSATAHCRCSQRTGRTLGGGRWLLMCWLLLLPRAEPALPKAQPAELCCCGTVRPAACLQAYATCWPKAVTAGWDAAQAWLRYACSDTHKLKFCDGHTSGWQPCMWLHTCDGDSKHVKILNFKRCTGESCLCACWMSLLKSTPVNRLPVSYCCAEARAAADRPINASVRRQAAPVGSGRGRRGPTFRAGDVFSTAQWAPEPLAHSSS